MKKLAIVLLLSAANVLASPVWVKIDDNAVNISNPKAELIQTSMEYHVVKRGETCTKSLTPVKLKLSGSYESSLEFNRVCVDGFMKYVIYNTSHRDYTTMKDFVRDFKDFSVTIEGVSYKFKSNRNELTDVE